MNGTSWDVDDAEIILSFVVVNPGTCQSSPAVIVSAQVANTDCQVDIVATDMVKDDTTVPFDKCRACTGVCEACENCNVRCDSQDAHPLKVHAPAFVRKEISQSSSWPGSNNTISVTFEANIELTSATAIFISGFAGGNATNGSIAVASPFASLQTAEWHDENKLLYIDVGQPGTKTGESSGNTTYSLSFVLTNSLISQRSPLITIWALNTGTCMAPVPKCTMDRSSDAASMPLHIDDRGTSSGDTIPRSFEHWPGHCGRTTA